MIVRIDDTNRALYDELFTSLNDDAKNAGVVIKNVDNLPSYYNALDQIRKNEKLYKYLRVPIDEQPFVIEADRSITVPTHFRTNGLGVHGDHTAEVIFFYIDRFFDEMDLSTCMNHTADLSGCYIQWKNAEGDERVSRAYAFDVTENAIIFGWVVSNEVTKTPGNVEFSVRFILGNVEDPTAIDYSFSSLTAVCAIKPGLNMDIASMPEIEDLSDLMETRPMYSSIVNTAEGARPSIIIDLESIGDLVNIAEEDEVPVYALTLAVEAQSPDNGELVYMWYKNDAVLENETNASYEAVEAGRYYVYIGNKKMNDAGLESTRWEQSNTCWIPEADPITFINGDDLPERWLTSQGLISASVVRAGTNGGGVLTYEWFINNGDTPVDIQKITGENTESIFNPEGAQEGKLWVKVTNFRNNITKETISRECLLRNDPRGTEPYEVVIEQDENSGVLTCKVKAKEGFNLFENEVYYEWMSEAKGPLGVHTRTYSPTESGTYSCIVKRIVFGNNEYVSESCYSNRIKI